MSFVSTFQETGTQSAPKKEITHGNDTMPLLVRVKEEIVEEEEPPITNETMASVQDSSILQKILDKLTASEAHNRFLELRIQDVERRASESENILKTAEETIRATCHYLKESSKIIESQAKTIAETHEMKDSKRIRKQLEQMESVQHKCKRIIAEIPKEFSKKFERLESDIDKFGGVLIEEMTTKMNESLKSFEKMVKFNLDIQLSELETRNETTLKKYSKIHLDEMKKIRKQQENINKILVDESKELKSNNDVLASMKHLLETFFGSEKLPIPVPPVISVKNGEAMRKTECIFCTHTDHSSKDCPFFSTKLSRYIQLDFKKICTKCLKAKHDGDMCRERINVCLKCDDDEVMIPSQHHPIICDIRRQKKEADGKWKKNRFEPY